MNRRLPSPNTPPRRWKRRVLVQSIASLAIVSALPVLATTNIFNGGSWNVAADWSLNHTPASSDALFLNNPALTDSWLNGSFTAQSLSFDTGADSFKIDPNSSGTTGRTLTLIGGGGINPVGTLDLLATSATTTGTITFGGAAGIGSLTLAFGSTNGTINVANAAATLVLGQASIVTGTAGITKNGAGTLVLSGANTYTGGTTINAGTLQVASANALSPTGTITFGGGTLQYSSGNTTDYSSRFSTAPGQVYRVDTNGQTVTFATPLTTTYGTLVKTGAGTLKLTGNGSSVDVVLQSGVLDISGQSGFITTGNFTLNGGSLVYGGRTTAGAGGLSGTGNLVLTNSVSFGVLFTVNSSSIVSTTFSGTLSGAGSLIKSGSSTLVLAGDNSGFPGTLSVNGGTLQLASANAAASSPVSLNGGALSYGNLTEVNLGGIAGTGTLPTQNDAGSPVAVSVGGNGGNTTFGNLSSGTIVGTGTLIKVGFGTLTLQTVTGTNAAITLAAGTLNIGAAGTVLGTGVFTINGGAVNFGTLPTSTAGALAGSGNLVLTNTLNQGVNFNVGSNNASTVFSGTLSGLGSITKAGTGTLTLTGDNSAFTGGISIPAGLLRLGSVNAVAGSTVGTNGLSFGNLTAATLGGIAGSSALITNNDAGAPVAVSVGANNQNTTYTGQVTGSGSIIKVGSGTLTFGNFNSTAPITLNAGVLAMTSAGFGTGTFTINGGSVNFGTIPSIAIGGLAGSGNLVLTNTLSQGVFISVGGNNASTVFSGTLSGLGSLAKAGTGTLTLSGDNSGFTGGISVNAGTLRLANVNAVAGSTVAASNLSFGTLTAATLGGLNGSSNLVTQNDAGAPVAVSVGANNQNTTYTGPVTGNGALIKVGTGTLTIGNVNTTAPITVSAGVLATTGAGFGSGVITMNGGAIGFASMGSASFGGLAGSGNLVLTNALNQGVFLTVGGNNASTVFSGTLSGSGALAKAGTGTLTLSGDNSGFTNNVNLLNGTLVLAAPNATGQGTLVWSNGTLVFNGVSAVTLGGLATASTVTLSTQNDLGLGVNVTVGSNNQNTTFQGSITGPGSLTKVGTGTLTLNNGTISTPVTLTAGTLAINPTVTIPGTLNANGGALSVSGSDTIGALAGTGNLALSGGGTLSAGGSNASTTYSGSLSGSIGINKTGNGTWTLSGDNSGYSGVLGVFGGTVQLASPNAAAGSVVSVNGGNLTFGAITNATLGGLSSPTGPTIALQNSLGGAVALSVGANGANTTYAGTLIGPGSLIKVGAGTLTLLVPQSHAGGTVVSAGTLQLSSSPFTSTLGTGPVNVGRFGTLSGTGLISGNTFVDGILAPGSTVGTLAFGSTLTFSINSHLQIDLTSSGSDQILGNGQITLGGNLDLTVTGFTPAVGQKFFIIDTGPTGITMAGLFANATPITATTATIISGGFQFQVNYADSAGDGGSNDVSLTYVGTASSGTSSSTTYSWLGGGSDQNWSTAGNWQGTVAPISDAANTTLIFGGSPSASYLSPNNTAAGFNVAALFFGPGTGSYTLTGQPFNLGSGGLSSSRSGVQTIQNNVTLLASQTWNVDAGGTVAVSGSISGSASLTKAGAGTLLLSGTNTYNGGTNLNGGIVSLGSAGALGTTGTISFGGGTLQFTSANTTDYSARFSNASGQLYNFDTNGQNVTLATALTSSSGVLTKSGTGTLILSGTNTYTGGTNLNGGIVSLGSAGALGTTGTISFNGGTLQFTAANTTDYSARFNTAAGQFYNFDTNGQSVTLASALTSTVGVLTKSGAGTLTLSGTNTYTGGTVINGGTLNLGNAGALGTTGTITFGGGTLQYSASNVTDYSSRFDQATAGQIYSIDTNGQTVNFGTPLTNAADSLVKIGTGTLRLFGNNWAVSITMNAGSLEISSNPTQLAGSTLIVNGGSLVFGSLTSVTVGGLAGSGTLNLANNSASPVALTVGANNASTTFSGSLGVTGSLIKTGTGTLTLSGNNSSFPGGIQINNGTLLLANVNAAAGSTVALNGGTLSFGQLTAVNLGGLFAGDLLLQNDGGQAVALTVGGNNQNTSINGAITGPGTLIKTGTGTLTLFNTNSTAAITLNAGTLNVGNTSVTLGTGVFTINGGLLSFGSQLNSSAGALAGTGTLTLANNSSSPVTFTVGGNNLSTVFSGTLAGLGVLTKTGTGTLTLNGDNSSFAGGIQINAGTVQLASVNAAAGGSVALNGGSLSFGQLTAVTLGGLFGGGTLALQNDALAPVAVSVGANNQNTSTGIVFTGPGTLIKIGTGTLTLANGSSTAGITLNAGTLKLASTGLGTGVFTINGGTLSFGTAGGATAGGLAGSGTLTLLNDLSNGVSFTVGGNDLSTNFSGTLAGTGSLIKTGAGTLTLSGDSSGFGGGILLNSGTLQLASINAAAGATVQYNGGTLSFGQLTALTLGGLFSSFALPLQNDAGLPVTVSVGANNLTSFINAGVTGPGTLVKVGTGTLNLNSSSSTAAITLNAGTLNIGSTSDGLGTGVFTINGGTLSFGNLFNTTAGGLAGSGTLTLLNNASLPVTFTVGGNNLSTVFSGSLAGSGSLAKTGSGTLTLSGDSSSFNGGLQLNAGAVRLANANAAAGATVQFNGGSLYFGTLTAATLGQIVGSNPLALQNDALAAVAVSVGANNSDATFNGAISGPGSLIKVGTGTLTIAGTGTYIGGTYLNGGSLTPAAPNVFGTGLLTFDGGTLRYTSNTTDYSPVFSTASNQPFSISVTSNPVSFASPLISPGGSLTKQGIGLLSLNAVNIYTGPTTVAGGTLAVNAVNGIPASSAVTVNASATFALNASSDAIGSLAGAGNVTLGTNSTLNTGNDNTSTTFSGSISGASGTLTKSGTGAFTLSGTNTYGGATNVTGGALIVSGSLNGTASVTVGDGVNPAKLGGAGVITPVNGGALTVKGGTTLAPDNGNASGLTISAAASGAATVNFQAGSTLQLSMANNRAPVGGAPSLDDYAKLTIGTGVTANLGGNIVTGFDGPLNNGDVFTIIINSGGSITGSFANTLTAAPNSAGSTFRFTSNGLVWDINYAWTGSTPLANFDRLTFEQTTGGNNVALFLVQVPEPGSLVSLLGGCALVLGWCRRCRRAY